jgi:hypothetical protein
MKRSRFSPLAWLPGLILILLPTVGHAGVVLMVSLETSPLVGSAAGPFALDFTLIQGNGDAGNTTVVVSDFHFDAAQPPSTPSLTGGAAGDLASGVTLTDSAFFSDFFQAFTPGAALAFTVTLTSSDAGSIPDGFAFSILDGMGFPIPTLAADGGSLLTVEVRGTTTPDDIATFATDPAFTSIDLAAPTVEIAAVPEPSTLAMTGSALLVGLGYGRWRRRRAP